MGHEATDHRLRREKQRARQGEAGAADSEDDGDEHRPEQERRRKPCKIQRGGEEGGGRQERDPAESRAEIGQGLLQVAEGLAGGGRRPGGATPPGDDCHGSGPQWRMSKSVSNATFHTVISRVHDNHAVILWPRSGTQDPEPPTEPCSAQPTDLDPGFACSGPK